MSEEKYTWRQAHLLNQETGTSCTIGSKTVNFLWFHDTGLTPIGSTLYVFLVVRAIKGIFTSEREVDRFMSEYDIPRNQWRDRTSLDEETKEKLKEEAIRRYLEKYPIVKRT